MPRPLALAALLLAALLPAALTACRSEPTIVIRFEPQDLASSSTSKPAPTPAPAAAATDAGGGTTRSSGPSRPRDAPVPTRAASSDCTRDADCSTARADCCGCNEGGSAIAIALRAVAAHEAVLRARCGDQLCPQVMSTHPSCSRQPACRAGRCVLVASER